MNRNLLKATSLLMTVFLLGAVMLFTSCEHPMEKYATITFDTDGGNEIDYQRIYKGSTLSTVKNPKKENYGFDGWLLNGEKFDFSTPVSEDITLKAQWKWLYKVTFDSLGGTNIGTVKVMDGYTVAKPAVPSKGANIFKGWMTSADTEYNFASPVKSDFTLTAKWERKIFPNPYKFNNGSFVQTKEQWPERAQEIYEIYQKEMYGTWRTGEKVEYTIEGTTKSVTKKGSDGKALVDADGKEIKENVDDPLNKKIKLTITRPAGDKSVKLDAKVQLPDPDKCEMPSGGWPFVIGVGSGVSESVALANGYAFVYPSKESTFVYNGTTYKWDDGVGAIAADNINHTGLFYDLYPYDKADPESQTGELLAWSWGLSKIIDALYKGAAAELNINKENSIVTGVSRYGKAAAVCGTFEKRIKMVAPGCSGAGGMASYRYFSQDMKYDLSSVGASANYIWTANEPIGSLTSESEGGWFNDKFRTYTSGDDLPVDQYMLAAINADPNRYFVIMGAASQTDDWVNAPSMWLTFRAAETIYDFLGLHENIGCYFHNNGHAVAEDDMKYLIDYFNDKVYGKKTQIAQYDYKYALRTSVFEEEANYDPLFDEIDEQWNHPENNERSHKKLSEMRTGDLYKKN